MYVHCNLIIKNNNIIGNRISEEGAKKIAEILKKNYSVTKLSLGEFCLAEINQICARNQVILIHFSLVCAETTIFLVAAMGSCEETYFGYMRCNGSVEIT